MKRETVNDRQLDVRRKSSIRILVWDVYLLPVLLIMGFLIFAYFGRNPRIASELRHVAPRLIVAYFLVVHPLLCILRIVKSRRRFVLPCFAIVVSFFLGLLLPKMFVFFSA